MTNIIFLLIKIVISILVLVGISLLIVIAILILVLIGITFLIVIISIYDFIIDSIISIYDFIEEKWVFSTRREKLLNHIFRKTAGVSNNFPKIPQNWTPITEIRERGCFLKHLLNDNYYYAFHMILKYFNNSSVTDILDIRPFDAILDYYILFMLRDADIRKEKVKAMIYAIDDNSGLKKHFLLPLVNYYMMGNLPFKFVGQFLPNQALFKYGETFDAYRRLSLTKLVSQNCKISEEVCKFCKMYQNNIKYIGQTQELLIIYKVDQLLNKIDEFLKQEEPGI